MNAILPGGHVGLFKVVVYKEGYGFSVEATANVANFEYIIRVDSVNFSEGSLNGGTELEITGINFAVSLTDNQVFIGEKPNQFCHILTSTPTKITCTTPKKHAEDSAETPLKIIV